MRVLHFYKTYFPDSYGGVEQFIYQLARGSSLRGVEIDVLSLSSDVSSETHSLDNHTVHRVRRNFEFASTGFSFRAFARFADLARQADIVHYHYPWPFGDLVHFAVNPSKPTLLTYHSDIVRQQRLLKLYKPLMKRFLGSIDRIVATSQNYLETSDTLRDYVRDAGHPDWHRSFDLSNPTLCCWQMAGEDCDRFFLFIGVLRYYKGLHILLDASRHRLSAGGCGRDPSSRIAFACRPDRFDQYSFSGSSVRQRQGRATGASMRYCFRPTFAPKPSEFPCSKERCTGSR